MVFSEGNRRLYAALSALAVALPALLILAGLI